MYKYREKIQVCLTLEDKTHIASLLHAFCNITVGMLQ